jgi:cytochrome b
VLKYAKALVGALVAGLTAVQAGLDNGGISANEWVGVAIATLTALGLVWAIPNKPA